MKKLVLILLFTTIASAQSITEKYNSLSNRYEYYNSNNQMVGYKTYNSLKEAWEYYEVNTQSGYYTPQSSVNTELLYKALERKQNQYDNNVEYVQNNINNYAIYIVNLNVNDTIKNRINNKFNQCINTFNNGGYDFTNSNTVNQLVKWLYDTMNAFVKQEIDNYNKSLVKNKVIRNVYKKVKSGSTIWDVPDMPKAKSLGTVIDTTVYILEKANEDFYKVKYKDIVGYIYKNNIEP